MPCMCGDLYCKSCGPAQGNSYCDVCGAWATDGGCEKPEQCAAAAKTMLESEYQEWLESERHAEEYRRQNVKAPT